MKTRWGWFVVPPVVALSALFIAPQISLVVESLHPNLGLGLVGTRWTWSNYARIFADPYYRDTIGRTLGISFLTTGLCALIGLPMAYLLARSEAKIRATLLLVVVAPLLISIVVRSLGWMVLLSDNGPVNFALIWTGLIAEPAPFLYNEFGVVGGLVHAFLPLMIILLIGVVQQIDRSLEEAAADLGANRALAFRRVIIPLSLPGLAGASVLIFAMTASTYTVVVMLGGGKVLTTPVQIGQEFLTTLDYPLAAALSVVVAAISIALAVLGFRLTRAQYLERD